MPPHLTTGALAKHFGVAVWQILQAIKRGYLPEPDRVGIYRVWLEDDLPHIHDALSRAGYLSESEVPAR